MGKRIATRRMTCRDIDRWKSIRNLYLLNIDELISRGYGIDITHYSEWCRRALQISRSMDICSKCLVCPLAGGSILTLGCTENGLDNRRQKLNHSIKKGVTELTIESAKKYRKKFIKIFDGWESFGDL